MLLLDWTKRLFGTVNDRKLKRLAPQLAAINAREDHYAQLDDAQLKAQTPAFRQKLAGGARLDDILVDAFAVVREAARRTLKQRHFDVQLMGGIILHQGKIAEMKTGEGKTLVATLPCYLNALSGKPVHVVTVNDYLARRDAEWMGQIYQFLGLTTGCIVSELPDEERRAAYAADITYGTNNEFGFDYLRDNMKYTTADMVQRGHAFAIVDEVDSILIDEARTPLIISGPSEDRSQLYNQMDALVPQLDEAHYEVDEKSRAVALSDAGNERMETLLRGAKLLGKEDSLYDMAHVALVHHCNNALRAHKLFARDRDYIVKDDQVIIIDEFTGRMMAGRRYSDGLHQALEAKEHVAIQSENQTLASITFQNYFRLYDKLAGMTGTAQTEAEEFLEIYGLDVLVVPTNAPVCREDNNDEIYRTAEEKYAAIVEMLKDCKARGQPALVGTVSIEKSEMLAARLTKAGIRHHVLNARYHAQEAEIIAQAGRSDAITIATNMAGRGTDIQLGGNPDMRNAEGQTLTPDDIAADKKRVIQTGGLCVIGTERHESRRIDNQLRGRSGRQGDPGRSRFFLSLEDDLMRIFGTDRMDGMLKRLGLKDGEAIIHPWITRALERAQTKVEAHNFDMRKNILKYDDVMNDQRKVVFAQRREIMESENVAEMIADMRRQLVDEVADAHIPAKSWPEQWDLSGLGTQLKSLFGEPWPVDAWAREEGVGEEELRTRLAKKADERYAERRAQFGEELMGQVEKTLLLQLLDQHWREHLSLLEHLRQVIGLRGYAQRDPLNEYKLEAFTMFRDLLRRVRMDVVRLVMTVELRAETAPKLAPPPMMAAHAPQPAAGGLPPAGSMPPAGGQFGTPQPASRQLPAGSLPNSPTRKISRNARCPCGSGKKYKHCHGRVTA